MRERRGLSVRTPVLLGAALVLLLLSTVGSTRAALTYYSDYYEMQVNVSNIGVSLLENGNSVEGDGALLADRFTEEEKMVPGKRYEETISVRNTGAIDSYVRVILCRSWKRDGGKDRTLSPELICLDLNTEDWLVDANVSADGERYQERTVLYCRRPLAPGEESAPLCGQLWIDPAIAGQVKTEGTGTLTTSFLYQGCSFDLDVEVNAVQAANAADAMKSAWGVDVTVAQDGTLSLGQ